MEILINNENIHSILGALYTDLTEYMCVRHYLGRVYTTDTGSMTGCSLYCADMGTGEVRCLKFWQAENDCLVQWMILNMLT